MKPDLTTIAITLILPLAIVGILAWRIALLKLSNRRKRLYLASLHRRYNRR